MRCSRHDCGSCFLQGCILCSRMADSHRWSCRNTSGHSERTRHQLPATHSNRPAYTVSFFFSLLTPHRQIVRNCVHIPGNSHPGWQSCCRFLDNHHRWMADIPWVHCPNDIWENLQNTVLGPVEQSTCLKDKRSSYSTTIIGRQSNCSVS